jgi:hypothetical protein
MAATIGGRRTSVVLATTHTFALTRSRAVSIFLITSKGGECVVLLHNLWLVRIIVQPSSLLGLPFFHCALLWLLGRRWSFRRWFSSVPSVSMAISGVQFTSSLRLLRWMIGAVPRVTIPWVLSRWLRRVSAIVLISLLLWRSLHSATIWRMMSTSVWGLLLIPWVVLSIVRSVIFLAALGIALVRLAISVGLLRIGILSEVLWWRLLGRIALVILLMPVAVGCAVVVVVLAILLIYIVSVVFISSMLLLWVPIALAVRLIVVVILLLRRIASILWVHRSLLVLIVVVLARSAVLGSLIIGHAARAMAVGIARDCVKEVGL